MKNQRLILIVTALLLVMSLLLASCQSFNPPAPQAPVETNPVLNPEGPSITVSDQAPDGNTVTVERIFSNGPGWVAIHIDDNGSVGESIGHTGVVDGLNENVVVELEPGKATAVMYAMLHSDLGEVGKYEFPGADVPVGGKPENVQPQFSLIPGLPNTSITPLVEVSEQPVVGNTVIVDRVVSPEPAWIVIHDDHGGKPGHPLGFTAVNAGESTNVQILGLDLNHNNSRIMYAVLHVDAGQIGIAEFPIPRGEDGPDKPLTFNGVEVSKSFTNLSAPVEDLGQADQEATPETTATEMVMATAEPIVEEPGSTETPSDPGGHGHIVEPTTPGVEPTITVSNQDVLAAGSVKVDRVFSLGPGWVVIYSEGTDGQADENLGQAAIQNGENTDINVPIDVTRVTPRLHAILHEDTGQIGTFEFPNNDFPLHVGIRMVRSIFESASQAAEATQETPASEQVASVRVEDQPIRGGWVIIDEVYSNGPGWVGVHLSQEDGSLSHTAAIGAGLLQPGLNHNVHVQLRNPQRATGVMWAMVHEDNPPYGQYNFPDAPGNDKPVLVDGKDVVDPFKITGGLDGQEVLINTTSVGGNTFLVDSSGYSLYTLAFGDCNAICQDTWLPMLVNGPLKGGTGVDGLSLSSVGLGDGNRQVTYKGDPLFYYIGDIRPGDLNGQGLDGQWFIIPP